MRHLDDGVLRRWADEGPSVFSLSPAERDHLVGCADCQARLAEMRASTQTMSAWLASPDLSTDWRAAYTRLQSQSPARSEAVAPFRLRPRFAPLERRLPVQNTRWLKPVSAVALLAVPVAALFLTPLGTYAQGFLNLFTPKQFVAVPVTTDQMRALPNLSDYGTLTQPQRPTVKTVASAAEAAAATGLTLAQPGYLPDGAAAQVTYQVTSGATGSFTFSAAKAEATAKAKGKALPAMPANIDGSTLTVTTSPAVVAQYGESQIDPKVFEDAAKKAADGKQPAQLPQNAAQRIPQVLIAQMKAPVVTSTGVTVRELQDYLLQQPGIAPDLAAAIRSIGDPSSTLPIPVPADKVNSRPVQVQGVSGLLLGDSTGLGSGVVWQKDGVLYAVGGPLRDSEVLQIANALR